MTKKILAWIVAAAMVLTMMPAMTLTASAANDHPCDDKDACIVCTVAEKINALPDADDIDVNNAAAVVEQIHAIDRIKMELTDDQYDELLTLIETRRPSSGYGVDEPKAYMEALEELASLDAGGSLYIAKSFYSGGEELDWDKTDATFSIECIDAATSFEPLNVTLASAGDTYLGAIDSYSQDEKGWTNKYILPAGTYKITEVDYNAVTADGESFETTAAYKLDGVTVESNSAIIEVSEGDSTVITFGNYRLYTVKCEPSDNGSVSVKEESYKDYYSAGDEIKLDVIPNDGYDLDTLTYTPVGSDEETPIGDPVEIDENYTFMIPGENVKVTATFKKLAVDETCIAVSAVDEEDDSALEDVELSILDGNKNEVAKWTSTEAAHKIKGLKVGETYTVEIKAPEGYKYICDNTEFSINDDGTIWSEWLNVDYDHEGLPTILIELNKTYHYEIPWKTKIGTMYYGEPLHGLIDFDNIKCNGEKYPNGAFMGTGIVLVFKDENGDEHSTENSPVIPAGKYTVGGKMRFEDSYGISTYKFDDPINIEITQKVLTKDDFTVKQKVNARSVEKANNIELYAEIKKEALGETAGLEIKQFLGPDNFVYDDVSAVIESSIDESSTTEKTVINYEITGLEGADAGNYTLDGGKITGSITINGSVGEGTTPSADTGDDADPLLWFMIMMAAAGTAVVTRKIKA